MIKKRNKGFTLIELIIAIAIITTVIFIGYKVINKSSIFSQEQSQINNIQLGFNNLRKYMTEDFKQSKEFKSPREEDMNSDYKYEIKKGEGTEDTIEYKVEYKTKGNNKFYSIKRLVGTQEISFIENQRLYKTSSNDLNYPLLITYNEANKIYNIQLNYGKSKSDIYTFDVYKSDSQLVGNTSKPDIPSTGTGGNLVKQCLIQVSMFIQQIKYEARGASFDTEIDRCIDIINYIIDNFEMLWQNRDLFISKIDELKNSIDVVYSRVGNGNSQHKEDIRYYIQLSNSYIEKSIYILENQNYYDQLPELTGELIEDFTLLSRVSSNYYVCLKNINNYSLETTIKQGILQKMKNYLNSQGDKIVDNLQGKISTIQGEIDIINNSYLQPMYHPADNINEETIQTLCNSIDEVIKKLENYKNTEIKELLQKDNNKYKYFERPNNDQDILCGENLIDSISQGINTIIEEFKYIKYSLGVDM